MSRTDPALLYQRAEERLCQCGTAGSGEGHAEWCPWVGSKWWKWGERINARFNEPDERNAQGFNYHVARAEWLRAHIERAHTSLRLGFPDDAKETLAEGLKPYPRAALAGEKREKRV